MDPAMWPLLYLGAIPLSLLMGILSLFQFSQLYSLIVRAGAKSGSSSFWRFFRPYHKKFVRTLAAVVGDHDTFLSKIQPTHVILTAILIVLVIQLERVVWQMSVTSATTRRH